jgi:sulfur carrier protein ThiS
MEIFIERTKEKKKMKLSAKVNTVKKLLLELELNPEASLVVRNGALVADDEKLSEGDIIKILSVASGG